MAAGLTRVASDTPEPASLTDTFHWSTGTGGGRRVPEVSTSTAYCRSWSACTSGPNASDSSGSPPVTTTRRQANASTSASRAARVCSRPPAGSHEYFVSHQRQPTEQPCRRTKTHGTPALTPSPWIEWKHSAIRGMAGACAAQGFLSFRSSKGAE